MRISTIDGLLNLLDNLNPESSRATSRSAADSWAEILTRSGHPLNIDQPDVNLPAWADAGLLPPGAEHRALDVGCGLGRNTRWLAGHGWDALGVDVSGLALQTAESREPASTARFAECDFLRGTVPGGPFDLVYDSGCFHHVAPHRRISYLASLARVLAPGGLFGICTFTAGEMGAEQDDGELLLTGRFGDGIGYTIDDLIAIFADLVFLDGAPQATYTATVEVFSQPFLTAALFRRRAYDDEVSSA